MSIKLYQEGGMSLLKPRKRGRKAGTKRSLSNEEESRIQKLICEKRAEQLKMNFALRTRRAVKHLIAVKFGIELSIRCVGDYLK